MISISEQHNTLILKTLKKYVYMFIHFFPGSSMEFILGKIISHSCFTDREDESDES